MFGHDNQDNNNLVGMPTTTEPLADDTLATTAPVVNNHGPLEPSGLPAHDDNPVDQSFSAPGGNNDDLLSIKQQALQQLTPLVGHLNQTPEEKFRTTMMMIQGADNQSLIKDAYQAAQQIPDEKARAQALLDIVNEINYFTQHPADAA